MLLKIIILIIMIYIYPLKSIIKVITWNHIIASRLHLLENHNCTTFSSNFRRTIFPTQITYLSMLANWPKSVALFTISDVGTTREPYVYHPAFIHRRKSFGKKPYCLERKFSTAHLRMHAALKHTKISILWR